MKFELRPFQVSHHIGLEYSGAIPVHYAVPQGSMIGPLLFLLFVNDLADVLGALTLLFADEVKMVTRRTQNITCTVLLLPHGTGRRNGTFRSTLPNATISQLGEKFP